VIGASFIGLEAAASLRARGLEVDVVAPGARPLERVLGPELGEFIRGLHEEHGVRFHLGRKPARFEDAAVVLDDGSRLSTELTVVGVGVRPRIELAQSAGLEVDQGVLVDAYLQTSAPGVYAAGDMASWPDAATGERLRIEHWVVAERQGQTAARNIVGRREPFRAVPFFWSQHYDVSINYVGHATSWDRIELREASPKKTRSLPTGARGGSWRLRPYSATRRASRPRRCSSGETTKVSTRSLEPNRYVTSAPV
jgi:NADPH-dependent 2,4-dienoyl-CoA reductase/sulfur reductase-like enzyme